MNPEEQAEQVWKLKESKDLLEKANEHIQAGKRLLESMLVTNKNLQTMNEMLNARHLTFSTQLTSLQSENARLLSEIETLYDKIKHGDSEHQAWLKKAIAEHFSQGAGEKCICKADGAVIITCPHGNKLTGEKEVK